MLLIFCSCREYYTLYGLPQTGKSLDFLAYLNIFKGDAWGLLVGSLAVTILLGFLLSAPFNKSHLGSLVWSQLGVSMTALLQQNFDAKVDTWSKKTFVATARIGFFLIFSLYAALLTSNMTFTPPALISTVQDAMDLVSLNAIIWYHVS